MKYIETSIKSYKSRLAYEDERAIRAIKEGDYEIAAMAVNEAAKLKGAIEELEFLQDALTDSHVHVDIWGC